MRPIVFGTDGWRGVIADDFTFERVAVVIQAIGEHLSHEGKAEDGVVVGYDNRFASADFAQLAALVLTRQGLRVTLTAHSIPTPLVSFTIRHDHRGGGVMITASHNPARYNGVKFKPWFGGSAPEDATQVIAQRTNELLPTFDVAAVREKGADPALLEEADLVPAYLQAVLQFVDVERIRARDLRILVDPLYGSSQGVLDRALREAGCTVEMIHDEENPAFGGLHPEPIADQLQPLIAAVRTSTVDGAVASDGDGDRLGAVDERGNYVSPHHLFALLLMHLVEDRGMSGGVVKTVSTTTMIDQLAERYHLPLYETPIGFKYIGQLMMEKDILIGGEESGGIGVKGHIPERDATLASLLLIEMMAWRQTTLGGLLSQLRGIVGDHYYNRVDLQLDRPVTQEQLDLLRRSVPAQIDGVAIARINERDGLKLIFQDGSWLLLRASGTEPVLRIYAEADRPDRVEHLLDAGRQLLSKGQIRRAA